MLESIINRIHAEKIRVNYRHAGGVISDGAGLTQRKHTLNSNWTLRTHLNTVGIG